MKEFILSNIDEFDTFESYFGNAHIEDGFITIPYINLGLMAEHPLNHTQKLLFVDFSFLQIINPKYVSIYEKGVIRNKLETYNAKESQYFGGIFIGDNSPIDSEMEIQASDVFLIIPKDFKSSSNIWIPDFKEYKGKGNIKEKDVVNFLAKVTEVKKMAYV